MITLIECYYMFGRVFGYEIIFDEFIYNVDFF